MWTSLPQSSFLLAAATTLASSRPSSHHMRVKDNKPGPKARIATYKHVREFPYMNSVTALSP